MDVMCGGVRSSDDHLDGGAGDDSISGEVGGDVIFGVTASTSSSAALIATLLA
nr:hypothetical protein [Rubrobacteraceae bacterium]